MRLWNILSLLALFSVALCTNTTNVTELTDDTFDTFIKNNKYVFVDFYATWCNHCMAFAPTFEELAGVVKARGLPFVFAKVDANTNFHTREKCEVARYP